MRFRYESFDFSRHKFIAAIYLVLMVLTIVVWRYVLEILFNEQIIKIITSPLKI